MTETFLVSRLDLHLGSDEDGLAATDSHSMKVVGSIVSLLMTFAEALSPSTENLFTHLAHSGCLPETEQVHRVIEDFDLDRLKTEQLTPPCAIPDPVRELPDPPDSVCENNSRGRRTSRRGYSEAEKMAIRAFSDLGMPHGTYSQAAPSQQGAEEYRHAACGARVSTG